jgi:hypothetical protein
MALSRMDWPAMTGGQAERGGMLNMCGRLERADAVPQWGPLGWAGRPATWRQDLTAVGGRVKLNSAELAKSVGVLKYSVC